MNHPTEHHLSTSSIVDERDATALNGIVGLLFVVLGLVAGFVVIVVGGVNAVPLLIIAGIAIMVVSAFCAAGMFIIQPNQAMVLILFGNYIGTIKEPGWWWANPFAAFERRKVSMRVHNFTTETSKVNDAVGNPIEIAAVVVWRVADTALATFSVEDYEDFVAIQSETAIRHLGTEYPYDTYDEDESTSATLTLRSNPEDVARSLHVELQARLDDAGIEVIEARLTHLAYAPEIAEAMLRRQQAAAVVSARRTIVQGAVGMVDHALEMLAEDNVVELDEDRKATMVSNLLVVLTSETHTQPIVNAGSLY